MFAKGTKGPWIILTKESKFDKNSLCKILFEKNKSYREKNSKQNVFSNEKKIIFIYGVIKKVPKYLSA